MYKASDPQGHRGDDITPKPGTVLNTGAKVKPQVFSNQINTVLLPMYQTYNQYFKYSIIIYNVDTQQKDDSCVM